MVIMHPFKN